MYERLDLEAVKTRPPALANTVSELPRSLCDLATLSVAWPLLSLSPRGDGHPVLVLPGFMAGDQSTALLRRFLRMLGYEAKPWGQGTNTGRIQLLEEGLTRALYKLIKAYPGKQVSLVGQSLGGVFARELARRFPNDVRQVVTLGSPIGALDSGSTAPLVSGLFERISGLTVEEARLYLRQLDPKRPPPVPVTAIYSRGDGVVHWESCKETAAEHTENIEVRGAHCGMGFNAQIYSILADRLRQPAGAWRPWQKRTFGAGQ